MVILLLATVVLLPRPDASVKAALVLEPEQRARVAELQSTLIGRPEAVDASLELANLFLDGRRPDWTIVDRDRRARASPQRLSPAPPEGDRLRRSVRRAARVRGGRARDGAVRAASRPLRARRRAARRRAPGWALLTSTLAEVAKVDMKKQPYLAKEKIFKTLHPTFIPRPGGQDGAAGEDQAGEAGAVVSAARPGGWAAQSRPSGRERCGRGKNRTFNKRIKSPLLCQLSYAPGLFSFQFSSLSSAPEVSRTPNPRLRRPMLYPVELRAQKRDAE